MGVCDGNDEYTGLVSVFMSSFGRRKGQTKANVCGFVHCFDVVVWLLKHETIT